jgi:hypothetical protein
LIKGKRIGILESQFGAQLALAAMKWQSQLSPSDSIPMPSHPKCNAELIAPQQVSFWEQTQTQSTNPNGHYFIYIFLFIYYFWFVGRKKINEEETRNCDPKITIAALH